jgi:hypothetical protein
MTLGGVIFCVLLAQGKWSSILVVSFAIFIFTRPDFRDLLRSIRSVQNYNRFLVFIYLFRVVECSSVSIAYNSNNSRQYHVYTQDCRILFTQHQFSIGTSKNILLSIDLPTRYGTHYYFLFHFYFLYIFFFLFFKKKLLLLLLPLTVWSMFSMFSIGF